MTLPPGSRLGPYEIVAPIGAGGMGEVYRALDARLGRHVAIKVLTAAFADDKERLRRFQQEARAVAAISHPNILAIFDIGIADPPFLVTELLEGTTLRYAVAGRPLPVATTIDFGRQLASGLAAAHAKGIVHRDLKPDNIFVTNDSVVKLLDFGLAKPIAPRATDPESTRSIDGHVVGTIGYMAPEQVRGRNADARSDIFSFGAILYEMATGERAFKGESDAETMTAILRDQPPDIALQSDVPEPFSRIVRRCLEKDPGERFQSAVDLKFALESLLDRPAVTRAAPDAAREDRSIAVLPFAHVGSVDDEYFTEGLADDLTSALGRLEGLRVCSRTSTARFRQSKPDVREIGRELCVAFLVEGTVRRAGGQVRVAVRLIDASDGLQRWSERYDRAMTDASAVFAMQDEIVTAIVDAIAPTLAGDARRAVRRPTENLEAYELYLKGRHLWHVRPAGWVEQAIGYFEQVIALDPKYALAYAGLADCYAVNRTYGTVPAEPARERAHGAVARALALDPSLAEVQFSSGAHTMLFGPSWRSAEQPLRKAIAINPRMAEAVAYLSIVLACDGREDEAARTADEARAVEPASPLIHYLVATAYGSMGRFAAAEKAARRVLELQPDSLNGLRLLGVSLDGLGRYEEAISVLERAVVLSRLPMYIGQLGLAYGHAGDGDAALRLLNELAARAARGEYIIPSARLCIQVGLGDREGIRRELQACLDDRTPVPAIKIECGAALAAFRPYAAIADLVDRFMG